MKTHRFALAVTVVNVLAMFGFWSQMQVAGAQAVPDMLRARGLEIVDAPLAQSGRQGTHRQAGVKADGTGALVVQRGAPQAS